MIGTSGSGACELGDRATETFSAGGQLNPFAFMRGINARIQLKIS
jgi:hypothetical protein